MRRTKQVALVPVTEFPDRLMRERFDIALAPLAANPFNEARSNLKFLEYSLAGAATVASAVGPFSDGRLPLVRVGNRSHEWIAAIRRLIEDVAYRTDLAVAATAYIEQYHTVERSCDRVMNALSGLHPDTRRVPFRRAPEPFAATRSTTVIMPVHDAPGPHPRRDRVGAARTGRGKEPAADQRRIEAARDISGSCRRLGSSPGPHVYP